MRIQRLSAWLRRAVLNGGRRRLAIVIGAVAVLVAAFVVVPPLVRAHQAEEAREAAERLERAEMAAEMPRALAHKLLGLEEDTPGKDIGEGPANADADKLFALAYPGTDIPLNRVANARTAFAHTRGKGFPTDRRKPGVWASVGPTSARYPSGYLAGGRVTAMALDPACTPKRCRLWIAAAGGGIWRTDYALAATPGWTYLSDQFGINAIGSITLDPNDPSHNTLWVGTGEANVCGSGCVAGVGLYRSTDGGGHWSGPYGSNVFGGRGVGSIVVQPGDRNVLYVASTFSTNGHTAVCCSGGTRTTVPGAAPWGLYKSIDGGRTWRYLHNGSTSVSDCAGSDPVTIAQNKTPCSPRGVRQVVLDPSNPGTVYASSYARGVWRSRDAGASWAQIKPSLTAANASTLPWMAVTTAGGKTRMYVSEGHTNDASVYSRLFRSDDVTADSPAFTDLTSSDPANPGYGSYNFCTGQCWYDNVVYTPAGHPDLVYLLGSYSYAEVGGVSNGRGILLSTDAGASFTDESADADAAHQTAIHPDQHAIVTNPANPYQFIEGSDGGLIRSSGAFGDISSSCDARSQLPADQLARCKQLLSRVPTRLASINKGLPTLQFQSLSVSPFNPRVVQGGTQDNGTWETDGSKTLWTQRVGGDGGQSGFDAADPKFRFHTYYDASPDVNFSGGALDDWNWIGDPIYGTGGLFYVPIISDPVVSGTMFVGTTTVARTKTHGMGTMSLAEFRQHCNEATGDFTVTCGDWQNLGTKPLTSADFGDRAGGAMAAVERTPADHATVWAATATGRVFVSHNADADDAASVTFTRIDPLSSAAPNRFVSGVAVDPHNPNRAWISYSGFSANTPTTPGHVFEVVYDPAAGTATWTDRSNDLGDVPTNDVAYDDVTGDLYASTDFGVYRLTSGTTEWRLAAPGMPNVEVPSLTILPGKRLLYAGTHGLGAWSLKLS